MEKSLSTNNASDCAFGRFSDSEQTSQPAANSETRGTASTFIPDQKDPEVKPSKSKKKNKNSKKKKNQDILPTLIPEAESESNIAPKEVIPVTIKTVAPAIQESNSPANNRDQAVQKAKKNRKPAKTKKNVPKPVTPEDHLSHSKIEDQKDEILHEISSPVLDVNKSQGTGSESDNPMPDVTRIKSTSANGETSVPITNTSIKVLTTIEHDKVPIRTNSQDSNEQLCLNSLIDANKNLVAEVIATEIKPDSASIFHHEKDPDNCITPVEMGPPSYISDRTLSCPISDVCVLASEVNLVEPEQHRQVILPLAQTKLESADKKYENKEEIQDQIQEEVQVDIHQEIQKEIQKEIQEEIQEENQENTLEEVQGDIHEEILEEIQDEIHEEIQGGIHEEILEEIQDEIHEEIQGGIHEEILEEIQDEIHEEIQDYIHEENQENTLEEVQGDIHEEILDEIQDEIHEEIQDEIQDDIHEEIKEEVLDEILEEIQGDTQDDIQEDIQGDIHEEIKEEIQDDIKDEIQEEIQEEFQEDENKKESQEACHLKTIENQSNLCSKSNITDREIKLLSDTDVIELNAPNLDHESSQQDQTKNIHELPKYESNVSNDNTLESLNNKVLNEEDEGEGRLAASNPNDHSYILRENDSTGPDKLAKAPFKIDNTVDHTYEAAAEQDLNKVLGTQGTIHGESFRQNIFSVSKDVLKTCTEEAVAIQVTAKAVVDDIKSITQKFTDFGEKFSHMNSNKEDRNPNLNESIETKNRSHNITTDSQCLEDDLVDTSNQSNNGVSIFQCSTVSRTKSMLPAGEKVEGPIILDNSCNQVEGKQSSLAMSLSFNTPEPNIRPKTQDLLTEETVCQMSTCGEQDIRKNISHVTTSFISSITTMEPSLPGLSLGSDSEISIVEPECNLTTTLLDNLSDKPEIFDIELLKKGDPESCLLDSSASNVSVSETKALSAENFSCKTKDIEAPVVSQSSDLDKSNESRVILSNTIQNNLGPLENEQLPVTEQSPPSEDLPDQLCKKELNENEVLIHQSNLEIPASASQNEVKQISLDLNRQNNKPDQNSKDSPEPNLESENPDKQATRQKSLSHEITRTKSIDATRGARKKTDVKRSKIWKYIWPFGSSSIEVDDPLADERVNGDRQSQYSAGNLRGKEPSYPNELKRYKTIGKVGAKTDRKL